MNSLSDYSSFQSDCQQRCKTLYSSLNTHTLPLLCDTSKSNPSNPPHAFFGHASNSWLIGRDVESRRPGFAWVGLKTEVVRFRVLRFLGPEYPSPKVCTTCDSTSGQLNKISAQHWDALGVIGFRVQGCRFDVRGQNASQQPYMLKRAKLLHSIATLLARRAVYGVFRYFGKTPFFTICCHALRLKTGRKADTAWFFHGQKQRHMRPRRLEPRTHRRHGCSGDGGRVHIFTNSRQAGSVK